MPAASSPISCPPRRSGSCGNEGSWPRHDRPLLSTRSGGRVARRQQRHRPPMGRQRPDQSGAQCRGTPGGGRRRLGPLRHRIGRVARTRDAGRPVGSQPVGGHRHQGGEGQSGGPGRVAGRTVSSRVPHHPRGGRRTGAGARRSCRGGGEGHVGVHRATTRVRRPPIVPLTVAALATALFALPLLGLVWKAPWSVGWQELTSPPAVDALRLSLVTSLGATALAVLLGVPLAWVQARFRYPGRRLVRALTTLPLVLPPVVGGTALL